jgi:hypothetical protein
LFLHRIVAACSRKAVAPLLLLVTKDFGFSLEILSGRAVCMNESGSREPSLMLIEAVKVVRRKFERGRNMQQVRSTGPQASRGSTGQLAGLLKDLVWNRPQGRSGSSFGQRSLEAMSEEYSGKGRFYKTKPTSVALSTC